MQPDKDSGDLSLMEECESDRKLPHMFGQKKRKSHKEASSCFRHGCSSFSKYVHFMVCKFCFMQDSLFLIVVLKEGLSLAYFSYVSHVLQRKLIDGFKFCFMM